MTDDAQQLDFQNDGQELHSIKFDTQHKTFYLDLKEVANGKYLKISERRFGKKTTIIVPEEGIEPLARAVEEMKDKLAALESDKK